MISVKNNFTISILHKVILVFLLIVIPFFALNLAINLWGAKNLKSQISKSTAKQVDYYLDGFSSEIQRISEMQGLYLDDHDFKTIGFFWEDLGSYDRVITRKNVLNKLQLLKNLSPYIYEASTSFPLHSLIVNNNGITPELSREIYSKEAFEAINNSGSFPFIYHNNELFLNASFRVSEHPLFGNTLFNISIQLSRKYLENTLLNFLPYKTGSVIMINNNQEWAISNIKDGSMLSSMKNFCSLNKDSITSTSTTSIKIDGESYLVVYKYSAYLGITLAAFISEEEILADYIRYTTWFWLLCACAIIIIFLFSYSIYLLLDKPLNKLLTAFRKVEDGVLDIQISSKRNDEFKYLYENFNKMIINFKNLMKRMYEQDIRTQKAILKQLQYQINPHFLYNSIFMVHRMAVDQDYENIVRFTEHLGSFCKFITRSASNEIPFKSEVEHAKNYVEIQTFRFSNRIQAEFGDIPAGCENLMVPRLILQPVIENAYEHGLKNKSADGKLIVNMQKIDNSLCISVEDNGGNMDNDKLQILKNQLAYTGDDMENSGVINVHRRIQLRYGKDSGVLLTVNETGGLRVEISIVIT